MDIGQRIKGDFQRDILLILFDGLNATNGEPLGKDIVQSTCDNQVIGGDVFSFFNVTEVTEIGVGASFHTAPCSGSLHHAIHHRVTIRDE